MAAATENIFQARESEGVQTFPLVAFATDADIFKGTLVSTADASGFARPGTAAANERFLGVASEEVNQVSGDVDGTNNIRLFRTGKFTFVIVGATQADVGKRVNILDDQTVTLTGTGTVRCGTIVEFVSSTSVVVAINASAA